MIPEMAEYYRAMLLAGFRDKLDLAFDQTLETEDPLSDLMLSLSTCISDNGQVLAVLGAYTLNYTLDDQAVCDLIRADMRERYLAGEMTRAEVANTLYRIVMKMQKFWEEPWHSLTDAFYDLELFEDGLICREVFNQCFDAWFLEERNLNAWELERNYRRGVQ